MLSSDLQKWYGRTAYQIMPDRFFRSGPTPEPDITRKLKDWYDIMPDWKPDRDGEYRNQYFYGGNLKGIEEKLPYLKDLGFNMAYLMPICQSRANHHYDVGDHDTIDPWLGTWEDFRSLCSTGNQLDIPITVDLVFNHTGSYSKYFSDEKYDKWYKKTSTGKQIFWWGFTDMPECDCLNKGYQDAMKRVVEKYLEHGASAIRLDLGENLPEPFLRTIGEVKNEYPELLIIGEMWGIATDKEDPKIFDGQLDSVMNYPMADAILRWTRYGAAGHFQYNFDRVYREYPIQVQNVLLNNVGTHDTPTTMTMLVAPRMNPDVFNKRIWDIESPWLQGEKFNTYAFREYEATHDLLCEADYELGKKREKVALAIMWNIPGIPCIFQGAERGGVGYKDPFNRKPYPWEIEELERHNIISKEMKERIHEMLKGYPTKEQYEDLMFFVKALNRYRQANIDILGQGFVKLIRCDENVLILERYLGQKRLLVAVNRTPYYQGITLPCYNDNARIVFNEGNCSKDVLVPYGVMFVREEN